MIGGHEFGFVKLIAEKTRGEIIGAEIIGPHASDLIHELIAVMRYRGTAQELAAHAALSSDAGGDHHLPGGGNRGELAKSALDCFLRSSVGR